MLQKRFSDSQLFQNFSHREFDSSPENFPGRDIYLLTDESPISEKLSSAIHLRNLNGLSDAEVANGVFYTYFLCDSDALDSLRRIFKCGGIMIPHLHFGKTNYRYVDRHAFDALSRTESKLDRISHFDLSVHENICEALKITKHLDGDYLEIGVYKGGSALTALNYLDLIADASPGRRAVLLDTFDGFNYEEAASSVDAIWNGTHALFGVEQTIAYIKETFSDIKSKFAIHQSNICVDDINKYTNKVSVANLDVDMYEPTVDALNKVSPLVQVGGIIICEDPASTPGLYGALLAMEDFLCTNEGCKYVKSFKGGQYFLHKTK